MELKLETGTLDLPDDFTFAIVRTNPFFSDEGDASIPATIPPTDRNRQLLGNIDRIDIYAPHYQEISAMLSAGVWQKNGRLIVSTASRKDGFEASLAIENSDIYAQYKDKTLKEIFAQKPSLDLGGVENAVTYLKNLYNQYDTSGPLTIFPVAIAKYKEDGSDNEIYQYNNEINENGFVWQSRTVHEGDELVTVPDGYGISPFYFLNEMMKDLVALMGYECTSTGFPLETSRFVIINNCSDTICNGGVLKWQDLVPSITVAEFFEWLQNRFHIQPVVDSAARRVKFVCMETILSQGVSNMQADITDRVDGGWSIEINKPAHAVLSPTTDIEGAEAAAETFDKLIEKYGYYKLADEVVWSTIETSSNVNYRDCLVMRRSTGDFYEVRRRADNPDIPELKRVGSNYFAYDRNNEDDSEQFSQADTMPPMLCDNATRAVVPYIGERLNFHSVNINNSKEETEQKLMMVIEVVSSGIFYRHTGTTQKYVPGKVGDIAAVIHYNGTHNEDMYPKFWKLYNEQLRCGKTELTGTVRYTPAEAAMLDMTLPVYCGGQLLLPVETSIEVGEHTVCGEGKYVLVKNITDMEEDDPTPQPSTETSGLIWRFRDDHTSHYHPTAAEGAMLALGQGFELTTEEYTNFRAGNFDVSFILPQPLHEGQITEKKDITGLINVHFISKQGLNSHEVGPYDRDINYKGWFEAVAIPIIPTE